LIDIHSHILPGIDDGPEDMDTALKMITLAWENGTKSIIATPHFIYGERGCEASIREIENACAALVKKASEKGIGIDIHPGAEVFITPDLPELLDENIICTLNNSLYVLVELPLSSIPLYTQDVVLKLIVKGYVPVLAHPERNREIIENPGIVEAYIRSGVLIQVNSSSLKGLYGRAEKNTALNLIKQGMVHFVASDAHTINGRNTILYDTMRFVASKVGEEKAKELFINNGQAVIENRKIQI
jgi:protein-tyrosine phosphatase